MKKVAQILSQKYPHLAKRQNQLSRLKHYLEQKYPETKVLISANDRRLIIKTPDPASASRLKLDSNQIGNYCQDGQKLIIAVSVED